MRSTIAKWSFAVLIKKASAQRRSPEATGTHPPTAPSPNPQQSSFRDVVKAATRNLQNLSEEAVVQQALEAIRSRPFDEAKPIVLAAIEDLAENRVAQLNIRCYRDALTAAYNCGLYQASMRLFRGRYDALGNTDNTFCVYDVNVDTAFELGDTSEVLFLSRACTEKMLRHPQEVLCDFSHCRLWWRLHCLAVAKRISAEEFGSASRTVWQNMCSYLGAPAKEKLHYDHVSAATRRYVLYGQETDFGEMHFFAFCRSNGMLRCATAMTALAHSSMIRSCRVGKWVDVASQYYREATATGEVEEFVIVSYLMVLQNAKSHKKIVELMGPFAAHTKVLLQCSRHRRYGSWGGTGRSSGSCGSRCFGDWSRCR